MGGGASSHGGKVHKARREYHPPPATAPGNAGRVPTRKESKETRQEYYRRRWNVPAVPDIQARASTRTKYGWTGANWAALEEMRHTPKNISRRQKE